MDIKWIKTMKPLKSGEFTDSGKPPKKQSEKERCSRHQAAYDFE